MITKIRAAKVPSNPVENQTNSGLFISENALSRPDQARQWTEENRAAIYDYNMRIERRGVFSDGLRRF